MRARPILPIFSIFVVLVACGAGAPDRSALRANRSRPVPLGEWCDVLVADICERSGSCIGSSDVTAGCKETGPSSCVSGRDRAAPSGHVASDLAHCLEVVDKLACEGFMASLQKHSECQATAATP